MLSSTTSTLYKTRFRIIAPYFAFPMLLYIFMVITPLISAFYYSMNNTLNYKLVWVGFDNFINLIKDDIFWHSLKNNIILILVSIIFQVGPAFIILAIMTTRMILAKRFVTSVFFFPCVISPLVTAYVWKIMYSMQYGVINIMLDAVGLKSWQQNWLSDPKIIMVSIAIPLAWQYIGFYLVIFLAGLTTIEKEVLEVCEIDGATGYKRTIYVILPLMKKTINVALLLCISGGIKLFDQIYAMSMGGPGYASSVLAMYSYSKSFLQNDYGYGSAISVAMLIISFFIIIVMNKARRATKQDE